MENDKEIKNIDEEINDDKSLDEEDIDEINKEILFDTTLLFVQYILKTISKENLKELQTISKTWKSELVSFFGFTQKKMKEEILKLQSENKTEIEIANKIIDDFLEKEK